MIPIRTVWITRAQPGADQTAERLSALGLSPLAAPVLTLHPLDVRPDTEDFGALAFTSRNAVTLFAERSGDRNLPVFAVGDATAAAARKVGFTRVRSADGDLGALAGLLRTEATGLTVLHPSAAEPAGDLAALVGDMARVMSVAVYETRDSGTDLPQTWDVVLIHSPRAARALAGRLSPDVARGRIAVAISPAAAAPLAGLPFAEVRIADTPTETSLLATLGKPGSNV
ncbi:uroporphyrinogen-III synthase [Brevundimonas sp. NIBR11]|uniref:uroporphyrinogen-III synthase n=1 Tax=Brevundimonas sp. NIBR11 TaxID=3015999 RepID=UPI0022F0503D|nr:uroporphyrinogen-III synthase [Brevundimonas sp. NIBR11]WGM32570.1 hypothetical protein KKHFBJBL_02823 [Brevundimonas sp. NIBR11]